MKHVDFSDSEILQLALAIVTHLLLRLRNMNWVCHARVTIVLCRCEWTRRGNAMLVQSTMLYLLRFICILSRITFDFSRPSHSFYSVPYKRLRPNSRRSVKKVTTKFNIIKIQKIIFTILLNKFFFEWRN